MMGKSSVPQRRHRIGLVCPYAWDRPGGVQTHVRSLAGALRARGHDVLVLAPRLSSRDEDEPGVVSVGRANKVPANRSVAPIAFRPSAALGVTRALADFAPSLVHLHEPLIPSVSLVALYNSDAPLVGTFHASSEGNLSYKVFRPVLRRGIERLDVRTAMSEAARRLVSRYFPGDYPLTPHGIDLASFDRDDQIDLGDDRKVLFLSRLERRKGLAVLIEAMARLRDVQATLVVAGEGPQEQACRELAAKRGVRARFIGNVAEEDLPATYRSADVFCAPAVAGESFGIVLVEAMAAGTPVVCSSLPAFRRVAGEAALFAPPGDPAALADALRKILTDDDEARRRRELGAAAASRYDWARVIVQLEAHYEEALTRSGGPGATPSASAGSPKASTGRKA